jgi:TIR domain
MKIFISYERKDAKFVKQLRRSLKAIGIRPFTNNLKEFLGKEPLTLENLNRAMPGCSQAIVVLTPGYLRDPWLIEELGALRIKEANTRSEVILPIIAKPCKPPEQLEDHFIVDFPALGFEAAFDELSSRIQRQRHVFVVIDYGDEMKPTYNVIVNTIKATGFDPVEKEDLLRGKKLDEKILTDIARSEVVVADLTCNSANCYYEAGYAHALGKELILTNKKGIELPFDLRTYSSIEWSDAEELQRRLGDRLAILAKSQPRPPRNVAES